MSRKNIRIRLKRAYLSTAEFISKNKGYFIIAYLASSITLFCLQFYLFKNWDMLTRILDGNYLLHNGFYFEPERELLEAFIMGLLAFPLGQYAVYGFITVGAGLFIFALYRFCKAFSLDLLIVMMLFLNPFFIMFAASNGSEMFVIPFLLLAIAEIKNKSYLSGLFFALAFVSKYYALYFLPLLIFLFFGEDIIKAVKKTLVNITAFIAALVPFFAYNLLVYGNFVYTFALSYLNFGIEVGPAPFFVLNGFLELSVPAAILLFLMVIRKKRKLELRGDRLIDFAILLVALCIGVYIYYGTGGLLTFGSNAYRYFLPAFSFSLLMVAIFLRKQDLPWLACFATISLIVVAVMMVSTYVPAYQDNVAAQIAVSRFQSVYNTTNCTVYSNDWVPFDYYGLPAEAPPRYEPMLYNGTPIVNFGPDNTTYPLLLNEGNIYIYGGNYCKFYKVQASFISSENAYLLHMNETTIPYDPCFWLFRISPNISSIYDSCISINSFLLQKI